MNDYQKTLQNLFNLLHQANLADSDSDDRQEWQMQWDSCQSDYFGHLADAIVSIAGRPIFDHWCETSEIDFSLSSRNHR
jgi:hypothetical protein